MFNFCATNLNSTRPIFLIRIYLRISRLRACFWVVFASSLDKIVLLPCRAAKSEKQEGITNLFLRSPCLDFRCTGLLPPLSTTPLFIFSFYSPRYIWELQSATHNGEDNIRVGLYEHMYIHVCEDISKWISVKKN